MLKPAGETQHAIDMKVPVHRGLVSLAKGLLRLALDPALVVEPLDWAYNRMVKDGHERAPIMGVVLLLIHLRKDS